MNNEVTTGDAETENSTAEEKTNISAEDFAIQRLGQPAPEPQEEETPEVEEEVADEIATEEEEGSEESDESTEDENPKLNQKSKFFLRLI